jgi:hypothetical protein
MTDRCATPSHDRVLHGALSRLEPCAVKVARTVLRGRGDGNVALLPDHCYVTASVPRVKCPEHGVRQVAVPWARKGSAFTLLFEQAALALVREMPVLAAARLMAIRDTRLWRIVRHYVRQAIAGFDLSAVRGIGLDETACKRGHHYVTVFIDMARRKEPVLFVTPGRGKDTLHQFAAFLTEHGGEPGQILEVVCDLSPAFLHGVSEQLPNATITVDWFHIVQVFTRSVDDVRKLEGKEKPLPNHLRWALLKRGELEHLTTNQLIALAEITTQGLDTATAWRIKEKLAWVRKARSPRAAAGASRTSSTGPAPWSATPPAWRPCARHWRRCRTISTEWCNAGPRPTPMPAWRASTDSSRPLGPEPVDTATPPPSSP